MQKQLILCLAIFSILGSGFLCTKDNDRRISDCLKGKLEIKGICMNYVISVKEGNIDPSLIESSWQDPSTGTTYQNVFTLENPCSFPDNIKEGDEFYFYAKEKSNNDCIVCLAYRPTPQKHLQISISKTSCN